MKTSYDKSTDSLYVEVRAVPSCRTVEIEDDVMVDYGADGAPVGCDISTHRRRPVSSLAKSKSGIFLSTAERARNRVRLAGDHARKDARRAGRPPVALLIIADRFARKPVSAGELFLA
jgi:uncharacterized protein YuzE